MELKLGLGGKDSIFHLTISTFGLLVQITLPIVVAYTNNVNFFSNVVDRNLAVDKILLNISWGFNDNI